LTGGSLLADARVNADGTPDVMRWSRPQSDGPALQALTLMRWLPQVPHLQGRCRKLLSAELDFVVAQLGRPSYDMWEEESGQHYYTVLMHAAACAQGARYFAQGDEGARAAACDVAAREGFRRLQEFWDAEREFYRSRLQVEGGEPSKQLDSAVMLAALHARAAETHGVLDPKVQATLAALEKLFEASYAINRDLPAERAPAMGRYAQDRYYSGGAFYFATLGAAEFYYRLSAALARGHALPATTANRCFRERLCGGAPSAASAAGLALRRGDAFMRTVRRYTPANGELAEQFDQHNGEPRSARDLSWSYAAFITAAASRAEACGATGASS
jgi:glucoamylase